MEPNEKKFTLNNQDCLNNLINMSAEKDFVHVIYHTIISNYRLFKAR
jgi:hypothetical protein